MHHPRLSAPCRALSLCICAIFILAAAADAQSGRKIPKRPTTPDPVPSKDSDPPVAAPEAKKSDKPAVPILMARHLNDIVYSSSVYLDTVMSGFLERMSKADGVKVEPGGRDMNRKEASDAAKASQERYVVWFQLASDNSYGGSPYPDSPSTAAYLYVDYVIYSPATGKTKASGHVYQRQRAAGGLPLPQSGGTIEYNLRYAGMEFAERVLASLDFGGAATTPPIIH